MTDYCLKINIIQKMYQKIQNIYPQVVESGGRELEDRFVLKLRENGGVMGTLKHNRDRKRQEGPLDKATEDRRGYRYRENLGKETLPLSDSHSTRLLGTLNKSSHLVHYHL